MESASGAFGVGKSELVRRLVRASVDVGPALSVDGVERIEALTGQVRIVGRNLMQVLKAIEQYAVECSIIKVWTSESLGYVVDEMVQVYGGYGYSKEFPAEQAYRDARITRVP